MEWGYTAIPEIKTMAFVGKWVEPEVTMLNKISLTHIKFKNFYRIFCILSKMQNINF